MGVIFREYFGLLNIVSEFLVYKICFLEYRKNISKFVFLVLVFVVN